MRRRWMGVILLTFLLSLVLPLTSFGQGVEEIEKDKGPALQGGDLTGFSAPARFTVTLPECFDQLDNDEDTLTDYPDDPGCSSRLDEDEAEPVASFNVPLVSQDVQETLTRAIVKVQSSAPYRTLNRQVFNNPAVEEVTLKVAAPVITVASAANAGGAVANTAVGFSALLTYLQSFFTQPLLLFTRRRRKEWGIVYSSLTKLPLDLAVVRLFSAESGRLIQTRVTDRQGRYLLLLNPGRYRLEVTKVGFSFPSALLQDKKNDLEFVDLYHGEAVTTTSKSTVFTRPIPLDPLEKVETPREIFARKRRRRFQKGIAWSGPVLAAVSVMIRPTFTTTILFALQLMMLALFKRIAEGAQRHPWGSVKDTANGKPIALAIMRIFDAEFNKLLDTQITDTQGRYAFLVGKGIFYVTAEKPGYAAYRSGILDFTSLETTEIVHQDIKLKR